MKGATPPGIKKVFRSSTQFSVAGYRTQLFNPDDLDNVKKVQAGYKVQTLSAYLNQPATVGAAAIDFPKIDKELVKTNFFEYLDFALQFAPAQENEKEIRAQLAKIGVGPGKTFNFKDLPLEQKLEVGLGMKEGERKVDEAVANAGKAINGWRVSGLPGDSAHYNGDWLKRAAAAKAGIYGNDPAEATYPITRVDGDGRTLDGSKNNYTLTFPPGQQPPVNAFWSLTMYERQVPAFDREPDQSLSDQLADAAEHEDDSGRLADALHPEQVAGRRQGIELAAGAERHDLSGDAALLAEDGEPSILPPGEGTWKPPAIVAAN